MADAMGERAREAGVQIILGDAVTAVDVDGRSATGVRLESGAAIAASTVVAGIHPKPLARMLPDDALPAAYRAGLEQLEETAGALCVVALVDSKQHPPTDFNVFRLQGAPRQNLQGAYAQLRPSGKPGLTRLTVLKASAYADWSRWHDTRTGRRGPEYRAEKARQAQIALTEAERALGPLGEAQIIDVWTPLSLRDWMRAPQGGTYGVRHSIRDGIDFLVLTRPPLERLFLVGQNAIAPGLLGTSMGVLRVVDAIAGRAAVRELLDTNRSTGEM
jgi:all-trans-retinol 13,14-reductase